MTFACENGSQTSTNAEKSERGSRRLRKVQAPTRVPPAAPPQDVLSSRRQETRHLIGSSFSESSVRPSVYHHHQHTFQVRPFYFVFCVLCSLFLMGQGTRAPTRRAPSTTTRLPNLSHPSPSGPHVAYTDQTAELTSGGDVIKPVEGNISNSTNPWIPDQFLLGYKFTSQTTRCVKLFSSPPRYKHQHPIASSPPPSHPQVHQHQGERSGAFNSSSQQSSLPLGSKGTNISDSGKAPLKTSIAFPGGSTGSVSHSQCLLLNDELRRSICDNSARVRSESARFGRRQVASNDSLFEPSLERVHLPFCSHYTLSKLISNKDKAWLTENRHECERTLEILAEQDDKAHKIACEFDAVVARFDCNTDYSYPWKCSQCITAYHAWVCAMLLPYYRGDNRTRSCRNICHRVEQRCPYFHPFIKEQYAGEPAFKCIDRNIPDLPLITPNSAHGQKGDCYSLCDLDPELDDPELQCLSKTKIEAARRKGPVTRKQLGTPSRKEDDEKGEEKWTTKRADEGGGTLATPQERSSPLTPTTETTSTGNATTEVTSPGAYPSISSAATSTRTVYLLFRPWLLAASFCALMTFSVTFRVPVIYSSCRTGSNCGARRLVTD